MRITALAGLVIIPLYQLFTSQWPLYWGLVMLFIVANNFVSYRVARSFVREGEQVFSTIRNSDLLQSVDTFDEWWKLMLAYSVVLCGFDWLISTGLAKDVIFYAILLMVVNIFILYRGNCGRKAPGLRATLARAFVTGERLAERERRIPGTLAARTVDTIQRATVPVGMDVGTQL